MVKTVCAGNKARIDFKFGQYSTRSQVLAAVDRIDYHKENTNMTGGLKVTRFEVFGRGYQQRANVDRAIVLITDGVPTRDVNTLDDEVNLIKRMGIHIVGLGVTNKVRQSPISNYTVSQKSSTFELSVTLSNLNRFSKFLHCWKTYEICYKTHMTRPNSP